MTWRSLTVEQFNDLKNKVIIDVRSPCEFEQEFIPGAVNIPLLSNEERSEVGTIYKLKGEAIARRHAVGIIAPKIPDLIDRIAELKRPSHALIVHCWRGGLRSEAVVSFLSVVGIDSFRLTGGYKAWRQAVVSDFESDRYEFETVVLQGLTGSGKTDVLKELERLGEWVIDLESLANHRGSAFGGVGLGEQPTQKNFEAFLWKALRRATTGNDGGNADMSENESNSEKTTSKEAEKSSGKLRVFVEAESRKIGRLALPSSFLQRIRTGRRVLVESSLHARCKRVVAEYSANMDIVSVKETINNLQPLRERLGAKRVSELCDLLESKNYQALAEALLVEYYDPFYIRHVKAGQPYELTVSGDDPADGARKITEFFASDLRVNRECESSKKK